MLIAYVTTPPLLVYDLFNVEQLHLQIRDTVHVSINAHLSKQDIAPFGTLISHTPSFVCCPVLPAEE